MRIKTKIACDEIKQAGLLPDVTISRNAIVFLYAGGGKESAKSVSVLELVCLILDDSCKRYAPRAGNMTAARHLTGILARVEFGGASVNYRHARFLQISTDPCCINHQLRIRMRRESSRLDLTNFSSNRPILRPPRR